MCGLKKHLGGKVKGEAAGKWVRTRCGRQQSLLSPPWLGVLTMLDGEHISL